MMMLHRCDRGRVPRPVSTNRRSVDLSRQPRRTELAHARRRPPPHWSSRPPLSWDQPAMSSKHRHRVRQLTARRQTQRRARPHAHAARPSSRLRIAYSRRSRQRSSVWHFSQRCRRSNVAAHHHLRAGPSPFCWDLSSSRAPSQAHRHAHEFQQADHQRVPRAQAHRRALELQGIHRVVLQGVVLRPRAHEQFGHLPHHSLRTEVRRQHGFRWPSPGSGGRATLVGAPILAGQSRRRSSATSWLRCPPPHVGHVQSSPLVRRNARAGVDRGVVPVGHGRRQAEHVGARGTDHQNVVRGGDPPPQQPPSPHHD